MTERKCTIREKLVGDGCEVCNPQLFIDRLRDENQELRKLCAQAAAQFCTAVRGHADRALIQELQDVEEDP